MPSGAFIKFGLRILEVRRLLSICTPEDADYRIKKDNVERDEALLRGAHVLLCSHLEGYFEDLVSNLIDAYDHLASHVALLPEELRAHQVTGGSSKWDTKDPNKRWLERFPASLNLFCLLGVPKLLQIRFGLRYQ